MRYEQMSVELSELDLEQVAGGKGDRLTWASRAMRTYGNQTIEYANRVFGDMSAAPRQLAYGSSGPSRPSTASRITNTVRLVRPDFGRGSTLGR